MSRYRLSLALSLLGMFSAASAPGALIATLDVELTEVPDGRIRYEYTLANTAASEFPLDLFLLDTGENVHIDFETPPGWLLDFAPDEDTYEVLFLAEESSALLPGQSASFTLIAAARPDVLPYFAANQVHSFEEGGYVLGDTLTPFRPYALRPGDTNADGLVDIVDLNNVRNHFASAGNPVLGDTDPFDGVVGLYDLNQVRNNFGRDYNQLAVPEPATRFLLLLGASGILGRRCLGRRTFLPS